MLIPARLKQNDEIRIIAPSRTLDCVGGFATNQTAQEKLTQLGFKVTFGNHVSGMTLDGTNSISERIDDIHAAFSDPNVKAIQTVIGGFTSNELLPYLDFDLIANNPKIICGFSDFTALANAITAKTGLVTYYGPAYITLKMLDKAGVYQDNAFMQALTKSITSFDHHRHGQAMSGFYLTASGHFTQRLGKFIPQGVSMAKQLAVMSTRCFC